MDGDGRRDDDSMVKDNRVQWPWMVQGQLDSKGRRVGNTQTMDDVNGGSRTAMSTPADNGGHKGQCGIKRLKVDHQLN